MRYFILLFLHLTCFAVLAQSPEALAAFEPSVYTSADGYHLPYRVLWPADYNKEAIKRFPLIVFLHGAGERGNDNERQLIHGARMFMDNQRNFPAIVVAPQCPENEYWAQVNKAEDGSRVYNFDEKPNHSLQGVIELIDQLIAEESIDPDRVYVMGLSMGGMGTFEIVARRPDLFAAAAPICGGSNPALTPIYARRVSMWVFHGAADPVVDVDDSRRMVASLKEQRVKPRYTEYPGVGHNSWDNVFADSKLLMWLLSLRKKY